MEIARPSDDVLKSPINQEYASSFTGWDGGFHTRSNLEGQPNKIVPITSNQILDEIRLLKQLCNKANVDRLYALIIDHVRDKNNPHATDLSQFNTDILHLLYAEYTARGGTVSYEAFLNNIFQIYQVAGTADVWDGLDPSLLISVRVATQFIKEHNDSLTAHAPLFKKLFPGIPMSDDPSFALHSWYGIPKTYQFDITDLYTYIGKDGLLYTPEYPMLYPDYSQGRGMIPCFSARTNACKHSYTLNHGYTWGTENLTVTVDETATRLDPTKPVYLLTESTDTLPVEHTFTLKNMAVEEGKFYNVTLYVYLLTANLFSLRLRRDDLGVTNYIHYDMSKSLCMVDGNSDEMVSAIESLSSGYHRLCLCFKADFTGTIYFDYVPYKSLIETFAYVGTGQPLCYVFGGQFEEGIGWSPLIYTHDVPVTRTGGALTVPISTWYKFSLGVFSFEMTKPFPVNTETIRPIFAVRNATELTMQGVFKDHNMLLFEVFNAMGNQTLAYPSIPNTDANSTSAFGLTGTTAQLVTTGNIARELSILNVGRSDATSLCLGHDGNGHFYEGYFGSAVYYPQTLTLDNLTFLAGD